LQFTVAGFVGDTNGCAADAIVTAGGRRAGLARVQVERGSSRRFRLPRCLVSYPVSALDGDV
jgi:hypothetical protein